MEQYFRSYKQSLNKLKQIDIVLNAKANGQIPSNEKPAKYNGSLTPVKDHKLIGGRSYPDGLGKRMEDEETEEIHVRMNNPCNTKQVILDFKHLTLRLFEVRETMKEAGEEDSFTILFEDDCNGNTRHFFYQTP